MSELNVKIRKLRPDAVIPEYATAGAAGFDLVAAEDVIIEPGDIVRVPLGLAFEIPPGYEMQIRPRSGLSFRTPLKIANSPGTIDADYRGEVSVLIENTALGLDDKYVYGAETLDGEGVGWDVGPALPVGTYLVRKGDRIAQAVIQRVKRAAFEVVEELTETERGAGGFGSTGTEVTA